MDKSLGPTPGKGTITDLSIGVILVAERWSQKRGMMNWKNYFFKGEIIN